MLRRIGTVLGAGLAVAVLLAGCGGITDPATQNVTEDKGTIVSGTIDRLVPNNVDSPGTVYFSFIGDGTTTYNCGIAQVNDCALLRVGDHVVVTYKPDNVIVGTGVVDTVIDVERDLPHVPLPAPTPS